MYVAELREFRDYFMQHTTVEELKSLNLLGLQFALCEATDAMAGRFEGGASACVVRAGCCDVVV